MVIIDQVPILGYLPKQTLGAMQFTWSYRQSFILMGIIGNRKYILPQQFPILYHRYTPINSFKKYIFEACFKLDKNTAVRHRENTLSSSQNCDQGTISSLNGSIRSPKNQEL